MPASGEPLTNPDNIRDTLVLLADAHEISLDDDRLQHLVNMGRQMTLCQAAGYPPSPYSESGVIIQPPKHNAELDAYVSKIDFIPNAKGEEVSHQTRDNASRIGYDGLRAIQDYVLLMELTGLEPDVLRGTANHEMASLAVNFGFSFQSTAHMTGNPVVMASYKDMASEVFSDRAKKIESMLRDRLSREIPVGQKIQEVIDARGLTIDQARLEWLTQVATVNNSGGKFWIGESFNKDGFGVGSTLDDITRRNGSTVASVDFAPEIDGTPTREPSLDNRDHISAASLVGIRAIQDYVILVEAGYITRPDRFRSWANWPIARIAEHFGFEITQRREVPRVEADYDDLAEAAFSPEIQRLEAIFEERVARL